MSEPCAFDGVHGCVSEVAPLVGGVLPVAATPRHLPDVLVLRGAGPCYLERCAGLAAGGVLGVVLDLFLTELELGDCCVGLRDLVAEDVVAVFGVLGEACAGVFGVEVFRFLGELGSLGFPVLPV